MTNSATEREYAPQTALYRKAIRLLFGPDHVAAARAAADALDHNPRTVERLLSGKYEVNPGNAQGLLKLIDERLSDLAAIRPSVEAMAREKTEVRRS